MSPSIRSTMYCPTLTLIAGALLLSACNDVAGPVQDKLDDDPRNAPVELSASYDGLFDRSVLVLEVEEPASAAAPIDVFRALLQAADTLQDRTFTSVRLHSPTQGHVFTLDGAYFKRIGEEYDFQNPVYTMRTFPYELRRPDDAAAYLNSGGGFFGLGDQFDDFGEAIRTWSM